MVAGGATTELRRGVLAYCVLAVLRRGPAYGFDLVRSLAAHEGLATSEGTIYPLLNRLHRDGLLRSTWTPSADGPPRRYYHLTAAGRRALAAFGVEWAAFRDSVERLLEETTP